MKMGSSSCKKNPDVRAGFCAFWTVWIDLNRTESYTQDKKEPSRLRRTPFLCEDHLLSYGMIVLLFCLIIYINSYLLLIFIRLSIFLICVSNVRGDMDSISHIISSDIFWESRIEMIDC